MAKIIDCGNGYGRIEGYPAPSASLTFPLTRPEVLRLYTLGVLSRDEVTDALSKMGYERADIKWSVAVAGISIEHWKEAINGMGTI